MPGCPASVRMTAKIADGRLPHLLLPEKAGQIWGRALAEEPAPPRAERGNLQIVAGSLLAVGEDAAVARDLLRPLIALYLGGMGAKGKNFYNDLARAYGYEEAAEKIRDLYLSGKKEAEAAAAAT